ncbi:MAG: lactate racemase domain-containing protein [Candidatus Omnitrophica bacterium]|nr:lactate racemase domain-containing protein [Candidatus Omnitrophota bacterium]MCM8827703.1 lactate racemase domain-containing protein [Candidatus Omnitrophota bacterium]
MIIKEKWRVDSSLSNTEFSSLLNEALALKFFEKQKILTIIPDGTRSGPTGLLFRTILDSLYGRASKIDFMIALGTHPAIGENQLEKLLGISCADLQSKYPETAVYQHCWDDSYIITEIGTITSKEIYEITKGLLDEDIPVTVNRNILDYDQIILAGPVFPHEVVGFSGGYKYIFPGVSGPHFLHKFHWLGALITNPKINGTKDTPVRDAINKAVSFIKTPITQICYVVKDKNVYGLYVGDNQAWSQAADLSAQLNIKYVKNSYKTVLSMAPLMYDDIWTAGKCMYKLEPVVADGGTLIIYAPHITEVSYTHGKYIEQVGYHTRDYFVKQWEKFKDFPGGILAHSTHVKGIGTFINGKENPRISVCLATGITKQMCEKINLGYINPGAIDINEFIRKPDTLVVRDAGEVLFRLENGDVPDIDELYRIHK